jgi:hypothetical protein
MPEEPGSARERVLARLIPPLAHRLNNLLALGAGELDLWAEHAAPGRGPGRRARAEAAVASIEEAGRLIRALAQFAKDPVPDLAVEVDPRDLLREVAGLCVPTAHEEGVKLAVLNRGERALFEADRNALTQALVVLVMSLMLEPASARPARVRLSARAARGDLVLSVVAAGCFKTAPLGADLSLVRYAELAGARFAARAGSAGTVWSVAFAALTFPVQTSEAPRGLRIALCMPDELLADLVASVLEEEGHRVERARRIREAVPLLGSSSVLFVDAEAEAEDPELFARVVRAAPATLILGGTRQAVPAGCIVLAKPVRPDDLLASLALLRRQASA